MVATAAQWFKYSAGMQLIWDQSLSVDQDFHWTISEADVLINALSG